MSTSLEITDSGVDPPLEVTVSIRIPVGTTSFTDENLRDRAAFDCNPVERMKPKARDAMLKRVTRRIGKRENIAECKKEMLKMVLPCNYLPSIPIPVFVHALRFMLYFQ